MHQIRREGILPRSSRQPTSPRGFDEVSEWPGAIRAAVQPRTRPSLTVEPRFPWRPLWLGVLCIVLLVAAGCSATVLAGQPRSMRYDPERAGGLPVNDGASGQRPTSPPPTGSVENTDGGTIDQVVLLAVNDIEAFWKGQYPKVFGGSFRPVSSLLSIDPNDLFGPSACGGSSEDIAFNAAYCRLDDSIDWDRSESGLLAAAYNYFGGAIAVVGAIAHEYGHAIQRRASLPEINRSLVAEQQADCFAGAYLRWVAEGQSPRFALSTGDGLNHLLAGVLALRDAQSTPDELALSENPHGTGLDRVGALQIGFEQGADRCAEIDSQEITKRRGSLPSALFSSLSQNSDASIDEDTLTSLTEVLGQIFHPTQPPSLATGSANCGDDHPTKYAAYCPASNTVTVDLPALQAISTPASEKDSVLIQGDDSAISLVTSRYVLALQHERGLELNTPAAAMRTACLTGVAQREMARPVDGTSGHSLTLSAGDLDEAIAGLLTNGVVASDVNGGTIPAGFTRVSAFRSGLLSDADDCYRRF